MTASKHRPARWRQVSRITRTIIPLIVISLVMVMTAQCNPAETPTAQAAEPACTVTMSVSGMMCGVACPPRVEKVLSGVSGVIDVKADFEKSRATLQASEAACDPAAHASMVSALKNAGYEGEVLDTQRLEAPAASATEAPNG